MNNIHFVEKGGASEPAVLCEEHAQRIEPFDAVSEPMDPSDEPCVVCFARYKDELIEVATDIIGTDGSGMSSFLNLVAGLLEARAEGDDEGADVFHAALGGIERAITNVQEIRFDKFNVGDAVVFTREVARPPHVTVPFGSRGTVELIWSESICIKLDRPVTGGDSVSYDAVWFDGEGGHDWRAEFLDSVSKTRASA